MLLWRNICYRGIDFIEAEFMPLREYILLYIEYIYIIMEAHVILKVFTVNTVYIQIGY